MNPADTECNVREISTRFVLLILIGGSLVIAPTIYSSYYIDLMKEKCTIYSPLDVIDKAKWDIYYKQVSNLLPIKSQHVEPYRSSILKFRSENGYNTQVNWIDAPYFGGVSQRIVQINHGSNPIARFTWTNASRITWLSLIGISSAEEGVSCGALRPEATDKLWLAFLV